MKHVPSDINNHCNVKDLKIIYDNIPDFGSEMFMSDFIYWQPSYDLYVIGDDVVATLDIAGVSVKEFSLYVDRRYLIIDGTRKSPNIFTNSRCTFHNIEIPYGRFNRRIDFPVPIETRRCRSSLNNGILTLRFPIEKEKIIPIEEA